MRIAFLGNGMTGYLHAQYRELAALGHDLLVVQPGRPDLAVGAMRDTAFSGLGTEEFATYVGWESLTPERLWGIVDGFVPDAVVMTSWNFSDAYRAVMKRLRRPVVRILVMDNLWRAAPKQWAGRLGHRLYLDPLVDAVMVPSERTEFYAQRLGFAPADVIRGSLSADTTLFASPPRDGAELSRRRTFLYVGRLVDHKGADLLAAAYARYRSLVAEPWGLKVVGMGPLEPVLAAVPGVELLGFRQPSEVAELMREVSCYVLPSHIEPYGVVVHEAAASALPVLCSEFAGAAAGMVQDGQNGWVVPASDEVAWAETMARMSALPPERLADMSRVSVALSQRISPKGWAVNLSEEIERRHAAGGGRIGRRVRPWKG
ncbi:glycosyltransferase family 4 protein [Nocardioides alcanivorans]|uniref:glycosyltransferase family 4 protein n=1 Tax=Nocardioides alcanivorans TaxID=2897352 RepID=UPI001F1AE828|nr:glycosyltransferase family 4 protein [Nocardioides alcanivorans]